MRNGDHWRDVPRQVLLIENKVLDPRPIPSMGDLPTAVAGLDHRRIVHSQGSAHGEVGQDPFLRDPISASR
jgi:hypothetical protein